MPNNSKQIEDLRSKQKLLKQQIIESLDLIIGTLNQSPAMRQPSLTTKVKGKTVSKYVRKGLISRVKTMTHNHKKVRDLIPKLSEINWELLKLESKE